MRIAVCGDVHVGNHVRMGGSVTASLNVRCREAVEVLRAAARRAVERKCEALVVAGDLFDTADPLPQMVSAVLDATIESAHAGEDGLRLIFMVGNHDQVSNAIGDHALDLFRFGVWGDASGYFAVDQPHEIGGVSLGALLVPYMPGRPLDYLAKALEENGPTPALIMHAGIIDGTTPPWLASSPTAITLSALRDLADRHDTGVVLAGDWHERKVWKDQGKATVMQLGALCPTGWDNPGLAGYGTLAVIEHGKLLGWEELPGPRFVKCTAAALEVMSEHARAAGMKLRALVQTDAANVGAARAALSACGVEGDVEIDRTALVVQGRAAAVAARQAPSFDAAVAAWVAVRGPVEEQRDEVVRRIREHVRAAGAAPLPTAPIDVRTITLDGFTVHKQATFTLPARGVVVVWGANGAGKSSLCEAVAMALWGETLRDWSPWAGETGAVGVELGDGTRVSRHRSKKRTRLEWADPDNPNVEWESTTHAERALGHLIGGFDVWRAASVFSSSDSARYALAADTERKKFLERVLGLSGFDVAYRAALAKAEAARTASLAAVQQAMAAQREVERWQGDEARAKSALAELGDAVEVPDPGPPPVPWAEPPGLARAHQLSAAAQAALLTAENELRWRRNAVAKEENAAWCKLCGQRLPTSCQAGHAELTARAEAEVEKARQVYDAARSAEADLAADVVEMELGVKAAVAAYQAEAAAYAERKAAAAVEVERARQRGQLTATLEAARARLAVARDAWTAAQRTATEAGVLVEVTAHVVAGLSTTGVRARIFDRALAAITDLANAWLQRFGRPGIEVELKSTTEQKSGAVVDKLSTVVRGCGGDQGYKGASGGERRRIDLAILLALAEVARPQGAGTLWFDEVLDAVDADGQAAVVRELAVLGQERCVVVITHSPGLRAQLAAAGAAVWELAAPMVTAGQGAQEDRADEPE